MESLDIDFIRITKKAGSIQGADPLMSELFARIFISQNPISMEELAKKTGYSLASISNKLKLLITSGIIRRVKKPGTKRIFLYMEKDISKIFLVHIAKKEEAFASVILAELPEIIKKHESRSSSDKEKVNILKGYLQQIEKFEKILNSFRKTLENL